MQQGNNSSQTPFSSILGNGDLLQNCQVHFRICGTWNPKDLVMFTASGCRMLPAKVAKKCLLNIRNLVLNVKAFCLVEQNIMACVIYKMKTGHISFNKKVKNKTSTQNNPSPPLPASLEDNSGKFQKVTEKKIKRHKYLLKARSSLWTVKEIFLIYRISLATGRRPVYMAYSLFVYF